MYLDSIIQVRIVNPESIISYLNTAKSEYIFVFMDGLCLGLAEYKVPLENCTIMKFAEIHIPINVRNSYKPVTSFITTREKLQGQLTRLSSFPCEIFLEK